MNYKLILFLLLFLFPLSAFGQDPYYINYDTKDGLPSSEVYAVEVDSNGIVWFATDRGVCSYNGYEFKAYTTEDGLANNTTLAIWKDLKGNFWFPGLDGSLSVYNHKKFYPYKWNDSLKATVHRTANIAWDTNENLYFWRIGIALSIYSVNNGTGKIKKEKFSDLARQFPVTKLKNAKFIKMNNYFLPGNDSIYWGPLVIDTDKNVYYSFKEKQFDKYEKLLFKYNKQTEITDSLSFNTAILNFEKENNGTLVVCTKKGLYRFKEGNIDLVPTHNFGELSISDIAIDLEGNYWITTLQNGIFKVPTFQFETIRTPLNTYSSEKILSIATLNNHILFGSSDGSLFAVDSNYNFREYEEGDIGEQHWFASTFQNYAYFKGMQISEKDQQLKFLDIPSSYTFPGLYQLKNRNIFGLGFFEVRILSPEFEKVFYPSEYIFKKRIVSIVEKDDKIWMGTADGLFSVKDYQYNNIKNESIGDSLLQVRINDLKLDSFGNIWISTIGNGIIYKTIDTIFQISTKDGLKSNFVNHVFIENDSSIWIATNKGLSNLIYSFDQNKLFLKRILSFTTTDGLLDNYINSVTKWKDRIWLATNKGICHFSSKDIKIVSVIPKIILENLYVNEDSVDLNSSNNFKYFQNDLYFKFTGISFRKQNDVPFYRYRLTSENSDSTWFYTNNRDARFSDLNPGSYTFEAAAQNKFGQWSEKPIVYRFTIQPHFTQTFWFRAFVFFVIAGMVIFLIQLRGKRIKNEEEQKRKVQEAELQALRNQMNPHFVFNALNSIQNFVFKNDAKKANYYLSRFSKLMRDGLQFARLKYISLQEEVIFLNTYLELEKMRFPDKFQYRVIVDEDIPTNQYFIPPLLFQPIFGKCCQACLQKYRLRRFFGNTI